MASVRGVGGGGGGINGVMYGVRCTGGVMLKNFGGIKSKGGSSSLFIAIGGLCWIGSQTSLFPSSVCNFL